MDNLFDIKCKNCGAPVSYDIVKRTYRCPNCGETSGIREVREAGRFRRLESRDRALRQSLREIVSCPCCGAEVLYEPGEESETCSFCGSKLVRKEFELSDQFPEYVIPFTVTVQEARENLKKWAARDPDGAPILAHTEALQGWYLPYILVRGPVSGYVLREQVRREFSVRGFLESTTVSTSRQLDNEVLDAAEPFDLSALVPFEHGYIAGHKVKLPDLSGAKRQRRTLQEAAGDLKAQLTGKFHTQGIRVNLEEGELLEIPILLPMYVLKVGRRLAVVNGQTGRVAVKSDRQKKRSPLWLLEPAALLLLIYLSMLLIIGNFWVALASCIPFLAAIWGEYRGGRFSILKNIITQSPTEQKAKASKGSPLQKNAYPITPIFQEIMGGVPVDVTYRFYPAVRVLTTVGKTLGIYFLPVILGAILHFLFGIGEHFRIMGCVPWFWCVGIFCCVYIFSGIRCDAYEKPYIYYLVNGKKGRLAGKASDRRLSFLQCIGLDPASAPLLEQEGIPRQKLTGIYLIAAVILIVSILTTIL